MAGPGLARLVLPVCLKRSVALVSVEGRPTADAVARLVDRATGVSGRRPTLALCLSDLSPEGLAFSRELALLIRDKISPGGGGPDLRMARIGLSPRQVRDLGIPTIPERAGSKEEKRGYARRVKPAGVDPERIAELDALEAYHPGGIAGFVEEVLARFAVVGFDDRGEGWPAEIG
jgi:hypothetical protein